VWLEPSVGRRGHRMVQKGLGRGSQTGRARVEPRGLRWMER
jgi:hypothetical protein